MQQIYYQSDWVFKTQVTLFCGELRQDRRSPQLLSLVVKPGRRSVSVGGELRSASESNCGKVRSRHSSPPKSAKRSRTVLLVKCYLLRQFVYFSFICQNVCMKFVWHTYMSLCRILYSRSTSLVPRMWQRC